MATYLITGCSRGLGLELVRQLAARPASDVKAVVATARGDAPPALATLMDSSGGRIHFVKMDVTSEKSTKDAAAAVESSVGAIDVLINNAGTINWMSEGIETMDDLNSTFASNVTGPHNVTCAFLPLLIKGHQKKVFNVSTSVGSMAMSDRYAVMNVPAYKVSKAALNMLTVQWALTYGKEHGVAFVTISPGWLRTDLGGPSAELSVEEGGKAVLDITAKYGLESNGKFFNIHVPGWENNPGLNQYDGKELPW